MVEIPAALIDEFGYLAGLRDAFAPTERRFQKLRDQLRELTSDEGAEEEFTVSGERYILDISAKSIERKVNLKAARRKLGVTLFMQCCSVTLSALSNFLAKPDVEALTLSERTGYRRYEPRLIRSAALKISGESNSDIHYDAERDRDLSLPVPDGY
jgi:hypothetical protein